MSRSDEPYIKHLINSRITSYQYVGGARRDRTDDPLRAKQVLSQLSYGPDQTLTRLSLDSPAGYWWVWVDLNHRPHPYQGCALTN